MTAAVANWTSVACTTSGTGSLTLSAAESGYVDFSDSIPAGEVYYSIESGGDREAGIGTFNGVSTITRTTVHATLVNGVFNDTNPSAISLGGSSIVSCTLNAHAYDALAAHTTNTLNPHTVTQTQVGLGNVEDIADADKVISDLTQTALNGKEDAFTKNTGFNLVLGTTTGTVSEGDHTHAGVYEPADSGIQTHIADSSLHFTVASISITESQISDLGTYLENITGESIEDLSDVYSLMTPIDGQVLTFDTTNGWQAETSTTGVTDHALLSNIGTNTHVQIDTHLALTDEHIDWSLTNAKNIHADNYEDTNTTYVSSDFVHDDLTGFVAGEHIDWSAAAAGTIHASNYVDNDTTYASSDFVHDNLSGVDVDEHIDWSLTNIKNIHADNYEDTNTTYVSSDFTHDSLTGVDADEHIDWSAVGAGTIDPSNYVDNDTTYVSSDFDHDSLTNYSVTQHRIINDAGSSLTELLSSSEITSRFSGKVSNDDSETGASSVVNMVSISQAAYDLLTPVATTVYVISG